MSGKAGPEINTTGIKINNIEKNFMSDEIDLSV